MTTTIGVIELADKIATRRGAQIVTMTARTIPDLTGGKKCPYNGRIEKVSIVNGMINWSYENAVNNQRMREGTPTDTYGDVIAFISAPRKWGERMHKTAFVRAIPKSTGNKSVYIELKVQNTLGHRYLVDGQEVDKSLIEPWLREKSESSRQGVEKKVILRDYRLSNIENITFNKEMYNLNITAEQESDLYDALEEESRLNKLMAQVQFVYYVY